VRSARNFFQNEVSKCLLQVIVLNIKNQQDISVPSSFKYLEASSNPSVKVENFRTPLGSV